MRHLMNLIRGMVCVRLTGLFPERIINLCAQAGIDFWAMEWLDEHTVRFTTRRYTLGLLEELAARWSGSPAGACPTSWAGSALATPFWRVWPSLCAR